MVCMREVNVVAFDCDGVLFDTEQSNRTYYNEILNYLGKPGLTAEQFAFVHMHTLDESLAYICNGEKSLAAAYAFRKTMNYREFFKFMKIEPGLVPLLRKMRHR